MADDPTEGMPEVEQTFGGSLTEKFNLERPGEMFEFIQKIAFPKMPLEMVAILTTKKEIALANRLANQIWVRMDIELRFPGTKTQLTEYVILLREYLRFSTAYKGVARSQFMEQAVAGFPRESEKRRLGRK